MTAVDLPKLAKGVEDVPGFEKDADRRFWSVTTLIDVLGSEGLIWWAAKETAKAAVHKRSTWLSIEESSGSLEAIDWLAKARFTPPKGERKSSELGSDVHAAAEEYALTGVKPSVARDVQPFLDRFDEWLSEWQPRYLATEASVFSPRYGYAGTLDAILEVDDPQTGESIRLIIDYKTSREGFDGRGRPKTPFPEVALQLAAYRYAELAAVARVRRWEERRRRYYLLNDWEKENAVPVPEVKGAGCIHITPDHCDLFPVRADLEVFDSFLAVMDAARFVLQLGNTVIGSPMVKP